MRRIFEVKLQDISIAKIDGEFKEVKGEEKIIPCMLTNYAVSQGRRQGILKSSVIEELFNMVGSDINKLNKAEAVEIAKRIDTEKCLTVIYIGCLGANRNLQMSYDEFLQNYHGDYIENTELYINLITSLINEDNEMANEFKKLTAKRKGKNEKK